MPSPGASRNLIHIISRFSNWNKTDIASAFVQKEVYANKSSWLKFLEIFLAAAGFLLLTAGIIFFFAYNWEDLSAFQKFLLVQVLLIVSCTAILLKKPPLLIKQLLLSVAVMLAGALWAVFGQVYQTGADTFDFYLAWLLSGVVWIFISRFPPLWAIGVLLLNLMVYFYFISDYRIWQKSAEFNCLSIVNAFLFVLIEWLQQIKPGFARPRWFAHFLATLAIGFLTLSTIAGITGSEGVHFTIGTILLTILIILHILWGQRHQSIFPMAICGLSAITIISTALLESMDGSSAILFTTGLFFVAATTGLIILLVRTKKAGKHMSEELRSYLYNIRTTAGENFNADEAAIYTAAEQQASIYSNIIIKILSVIGGIISSLFFVGFLAMASILESGVLVSILGTVFTIGALLLGKINRNLFLDTTIICMYVLGVTMVCIGLYDLFDNDNLVTATVLISGCLGIILSERFIPVFISALFVYGSFFGVVYANSWYEAIQFPVIVPGIGTLFLSFSEASLISAGKQINLRFKPLRAAGFIAFLAGIINVADFSSGTFTAVAHWFLPSFTWLAILFVIYRIINGIGKVSIKSQIFVYAIAIALAVPLFFAHYVSAAILMILLSWQFGYRTELVLSLAFFAYGLSRYYYDLRLTLLEKSGILCLSGLLLLTLWIFIRRQNSVHEKN